MRSVIALLAVVLYAAAAHGQGTGATLSGRILDSSGAVIPGAEVRIRNVNTNQSRAATARGDGEFVIPSLEPGQYELTATHQGFQRHVETDRWQLAGTGRLYSGAPFTPMVANSQTDLGEADRPDRVALGTLDNPGPERWFDLNAFVPVPTGAYRFGNSGRNILDGPGTIDFNLSLMKKFAVGERSYFQFRWEAFNVINHANFILPIRDVDAANGGTVTAAGNGRIMQFALRFVF